MNLNLDQMEDFVAQLERQLGNTEPVRERRENVLLQKGRETQAKVQELRKKKEVEEVTLRQNMRTPFHPLTNTDTQRRGE